MPSLILKNLPPAITSLTDKQLFDRLRSYNIDVGPVLPTTRSVYQRKLYALETGQQIEAHSYFPPVDNDDQEETDDDDQTVPKVLDPPRPRMRTTVAERRDEWEERSSQYGKPSPRKPLHPEVDYSQYGSSMAERKVPNATGKKSPTGAKSKRNTPASPATFSHNWSVPVRACLVLVVILILIALLIGVFFVNRNMKSEPVSNTSHAIEMEV